MAKFLPGHSVSIEIRNKISNRMQGRIPWNKGLTKETDERVAECASKTKEIFLTGKRAKPKGRKPFHKIPKQELEKPLSTREIINASDRKIFNVDPRLYNRLKSYGVPIRSKSEALKGRKILWADKIGKAQIGKEISMEQRRKQSQRMLGHIAWNKGIPRDEETKKLLSELAICIQRRTKRKY